MDKSKDLEKLREEFMDAGDRYVARQRRITNIVNRAASRHVSTLNALSAALNALPPHIAKAIVEQHPFHKENPFRELKEAEELAAQDASDYFEATIRLFDAIVEE